MLLIVHYIDIYGANPPIENGKKDISDNNTECLAKGRLKLDL